MRLLWMSNTPLAGTGYGVQTAEIVPRIKAAGHEIAVQCNFGVGGSAIEWNGIPLFPNAADQACNDIIHYRAESYRADWTISLYDVWTMQRQAWPERVASWVPIDHQPAPPAVAEWCRTVNPIAMSRFGQRMLRDQGIESTYIPHSINTNIFKPTDVARNGQKPREAFDIPDDAFVVMIAAANQGNHPPRKAWAQMLLGIGQFMRANPDVILYLHTNLSGPNRGINLEELQLAAGIPTDRVRHTNQGAYVGGHVRQEDLAALYTMSDVLLASSMGEGFGIPVIEAQACGLPVIVSDFSAQPELCESGWLVSGQLWWDESPGQGKAWFFDPFIHSIIKRLNDAYAARGDKGLRERAVAFAQQYDTDKVFATYWTPYLGELEALLTAPEPVNRAARRRAKKARKAA